MDKAVLRLLGLLLGLYGLQVRVNAGILDQDGKAKIHEIHEFMFQEASARREIKLYERQQAAALGHYQEQVCLVDSKRMLQGRFHRLLEQSRATQKQSVGLYFAAQQYNASLLALERAINDILLVDLPSQELFFGFPKPAWRPGVCGEAMEAFDCGCQGSSCGFVPCRALIEHLQYSLEDLNACVKNLVYKPWVCTDQFKRQRFDRYLKRCIEVCFRHYPQINKRLLQEDFVLRMGCLEWPEGLNWPLLYAARHWKCIYVIGLIYDLWPQGINFAPCVVDDNDLEVDISSQSSSSDDSSSQED